jgi:hypothetical protein
MDSLEDIGMNSTGQLDYLAATGPTSYKRTRGPARQPPYARVKNDPIKKTAKQQETNRTVEWLMDELQNCPGYPTFRSMFHQVKNNSDAVRSWTFAVDSLNAFNKLTKVVSDIVNHPHERRLTFLVRWLIQENQKD